MLWAHGGSVVGPWWARDGPIVPPQGSRAVAQVFISDESVSIRDQGVLLGWGRLQDLLPALRGLRRRGSIAVIAQ